MWEAFRHLTLGGEGQKSRGEEECDALTSVHAFKPENRENLSKCHFLRLPVEIRLQIYAYTDIGGHTIEVLHLPIAQTPQGLQCYRTYSDDPADHRLLFRLEAQDDDQQTKTSTASIPSKPGYAELAMRILPVVRSSALGSAESTEKRRCFSVHGLFSLTSVCRQIRADTQVLVYKLNAFAFTDKNYNYSRAIRAFMQPLTGREIAAVRCLCWPLVNILSYRRRSQGEKLERSDRRCEKEIRALTGLERVVLRHYGSDLTSNASRISGAEKEEYTALLAEHGGSDYAVQRQFHRTLAVRATKALLAREDVDVQCERSWRASF